MGNCGEDTPPPLLVDKSSAPHFERKSSSFGIVDAALHSNGLRSEHVVTGNHADHNARFLALFDSLGDYSGWEKVNVGVYRGVNSLWGGGGKQY